MCVGAEMRTAPWGGCTRRCRCLMFLKVSSAVMSPMLMWVVEVVWRMGEIIQYISVFLLTRVEAVAMSGNNNCGAGVYSFRLMPRLQERREEPAAIRVDALPRRRQSPLP